MTQYNDKVEQQRIKLAAEKWAKEVKSLHAHSLNSMYYAEGRDDGSVVDVQYNDGSVRRTIASNNKVVMLGESLKGQELVNEYIRNN